MERQKNTSNIIITLLSLAILTMSIGFAVYSTSLNLSGSVGVTASSWNVHFKTSSTPGNAITKTTGSNDITVTSASGTSVEWGTTLSKPGDYAEFEIDVLNEGTLDATLKKITLSGVSDTQKKYIKYKVTYNNTEYTQTTDNLNISLAKQSGTNPTTKTLKVRVEYYLPTSSSDLPSTDVTLTLTTQLSFEQA